MYWGPYSVHPILDALAATFDRDAQVIDKLNNSRAMCRAIQGDVEDAMSRRLLVSEALDGIAKTTVRVEELLAEAVQLLRSET